jgi:hypothetical protein
MKVVCVTFLLLGLLKPVYSKDYHPREGDIVFQSLPHLPLVDAIESVSNSKLSHCGIVFRQEQDWWVLEALGEVIVTPLTEWTERGRERWFMVCRFRTTTNIDTLKFIAAAKIYLGRPYDYRYMFNNEAIYCSELAYLAFKDVTGDTLGRVMKLGDLNWRPNEDFIRSMEDGGLPLEREMITPVDLSRARELQVIFP